MAQVHGKHPQLLHAVMDINNYQRRHVLLKLREHLDTIKGRTVGLLGLAFKQDTDDMREAPSITIGDYLDEQGAIVRGYDPVAMPAAQRVMSYLQVTSSPYELAEGVDAVVVLTPWNEFKHLDMVRIKGAMRTPVLIDGRNLYEPEEMRALGFDYCGIGRGYGC
jgi:UDPglucose 6-dehydrogenase